MSSPYVSLILQPDSLDRPSQAWLGSQLPDDRPKIKPPILSSRSNRSRTESWLLLPCACSGECIQYNVQRTHILAQMFSVLIELQRNNHMPFCSPFYPPRLIDSQWDVNESHWRLDTFPNSFTGTKKGKKEDCCSWCVGFAMLGEWCYAALYSNYSKFMYQEMYRPTTEICWLACAPIFLPSVF